MYRMAWTDERMDDFAKHTDQRFDAVDKRFDAVDQRFDAVDKRFDAVDQRFEQVDQRFSRVDGDIRDLRDEMKAGFKKIDERFEAMHRLLLQSSILVIVALIGLIATQL